MENRPNQTSKRIRSEDSSMDCLLNPSTENFCCPYCCYSTNSSADLDFHHHIHHQHICSRCLYIFPSYFLLDLHMDESHNAFFRPSSYRCLIESCSKYFSSRELRLEHIQNDHGILKDRRWKELFVYFSSSSSNNFSERRETNEMKFGCDSEKTFPKHSRLKPRPLESHRWDPED